MARLGRKRRLVLHVLDMQQNCRLFAVVTITQNVTYEEANVQRLFFFLWVHQSAT